jgi:hypothetical protein
LKIYCRPWQRGVPSLNISGVYLLRKLANEPLPPLEQMRAMTVTSVQWILSTHYPVDSIHTLLQVTSSLDYSLAKGAYHLHPSILLSVHPFILLSVYLSFYPSIYLSTYINTHCAPSIYKLHHPKMTPEVLSTWQDTRRGQVSPGIGLHTPVRCRRGAIPKKSIPEKSHNRD